MPLGMLTVGEIMLTVGEMVRAIRVMLPSSILPCGSPARLRMPLGMLTVGEIMLTVGGMVRALRWEAGCRAFGGGAVAPARFLLFPWVASAAHGGRRSGGGFFSGGGPRV